MKRGWQELSWVTIFSILSLFLYWVTIEFILKVFKSGEKDGGLILISVFFLLLLNYFTIIHWRKFFIEKKYVKDIKYKIVEVERWFHEEQKYKKIYFLKKLQQFNIFIYWHKYKTVEEWERESMGDNFLLDVIYREPEETYKYSENYSESKEAIMLKLFENLKWQFDNDKTDSVKLVKSVSELEEFTHDELLIMFQDHIRKEKNKNNKSEK